MRLQQRRVVTYHWCWTIAACDLILRLLLIRVTIAGSSVQPVQLWQSDADNYRVLNATVGHVGTCQPECSETRVLMVAPGIPYKISVEVMQADMQSHTEHVEVRLGQLHSALFACNPTPVSDYECSIVGCKDLAVGIVGSSGLLVRAKGYRMRDSCKCSFLADGTADCYSALLSGIDDTFGMLVQFRLTPDVQTKWAMGAWTGCSSWQCADPRAMSTRSVECVVSNHRAAQLPKPGYNDCAGPRPASSRPCTNTQGCAPPPLCDECFLLKHRVGGGQELHWSVNASGQLGLSSSVPISMQLIPGLSNRNAVSLQLCLSGDFVIRSRSSTPNASLLVGQDDGSDSFQERATFYLRRLSTSGYAFEDIENRSMIIFDPATFSLRMHNSSEVPDKREGFAFVATRSSDTSYCTPSQVPKYLPRHACRSQLGWCCQVQNPAKGDCWIPSDVSKAATCTLSNCTGYALLESDQCASIGCSPITNHSLCEKVATDFGRGKGTGAPNRAAILLSSRSAPFCVWSKQTAFSADRLWFNTVESNTPASARQAQLCHCNDGIVQWTLAWSIGAWGLCSLNCSNQWRTREVKCIATPTRRGSQTPHPDRGGVEQPFTRCLESGLTKPASAEPCPTQACFGLLSNTRCAGEERDLSDQEAQQLGKPLSNVTGGSHCVEPFGNSIIDSLDLCQRGCVRLGDCVGFTFYVTTPSVVGASLKCCFLRKAIRWELNFRHATCYLLHGVRTLSGCQCQVGWSQQAASLQHEAASGQGRKICGPSRGGCCTTTESGAVPWCPTTSPNCGAKLQGQQHWDLCDPQGVAAVTDGTCASRPHVGRQACKAANSISQCNQIATALGLPDTTPTLTSSTQMPSGCVWQKSSSQLLLNTPNSSQLANILASQDLPELCACSAHGFRWQEGNWGQCFRSPTGTCGTQTRLRSVWCVRQGVNDITSGGKIVSDSFCTSARPATSDTCSGCTGNTLAASAIFTIESHELRQSSYRSDFLQLCTTDLARAMGISETRLRVKLVDYSNVSRIQASLFVKESVLDNTAISEADALDNLMYILQSSYRHSQFAWSARFRRYAMGLSVSVTGMYKWLIHGNWGDCSVGCGGGVQRRSVQCVLYDFHSAPQYGMPAEYCDSTTEPGNEQVCSTRPCKSCPGLKLGPQYMMSNAGVMAHGSLIYVTCAGGYGTTDDAMLVSSQCDDGSWTPLGVSCGRSCPPFQLDLWRYRVKGSGYRHGATRQVTCSNRSSMAAESPLSATAVCNDGTWTRPMLVCTGDCQEIELSGAYSVLGRDPNGGGYVPHGASRRVSCVAGFSSSTTPAQVTLICNDGSWAQKQHLPDCKADCPHYVIPPGYEMQVKDRTLAAAHACRHMAADPADQPGVARRLPNPFVTPDGTGSKVSGGAPHGSQLPLQCADQDNRVPGAVESVKCTDGQWSTLSLVCGKDCSPINISSPEYRRFTFIGEEVLTESGEELVAWSNSSDTEAGRRYSHGTIVTVRCKNDRSSSFFSRALAPHPPVGVESALKGQLRCENGAWTHPALRCFDDCPPFEAGQQYSAVLPKMRGLPVETPVAHGTRVFATCAEGYSLVGDAHLGDEASNQSSVQRQPVNMLGSVFGEATCMDGTWSRLRLLCYKDCPELSLDSKFQISGGGARKLNAERIVQCTPNGAGGAMVQLRCSETGTWHRMQSMSNGNSEGHIPGKHFKVKHSCGCVDFVRRPMRKGVIAWMDANVAYKEVPDELIGATLFAGPQDTIPSGIFTVSAAQDGVAYIFSEGAIHDGFPPDASWTSVEGEMKVRSRSNMSVWKRSIPTDISLNILVAAPFKGGIAVKYVSQTALALELPYQILNQSSLCSPHDLIHSVEECTSAATALGIGEGNTQIFGKQTNRSYVFDVWVVPSNVQAKTPPGCFLTIDSSTNHVRLSFNPDVVSSQVSRSDVEWPICHLVASRMLEVPLDLTAPFPLACGPAPSPPRLWERNKEHEEALIVLLVIVLCLSLAGTACNLVKIVRISRRRSGRYRTATANSTSSEDVKAGDPWRLATVVGGARGSRNASPACHRRRGAHNYVQPEQTRQTACLKCRRNLATHVCFPCGHLCICMSCAEEFTLRFLGGETGITCPDCAEAIECLIDANPSKIFKSACGGRRWLWPMPTLFGRAAEMTSPVP